MAVHPPPPHPAVPDGDPAQIVNEFWNAFEGLFTRHNERLGIAGKPPLTWKELAENFAISDRTLSDWRNKRAIPSNPKSLLQAAEFLGGAKEEWQARWRKARSAHERLVGRQQARQQPGSADDHAPAATVGPPHSEAAAHNSAPDGSKTGANRPVRPRSPRQGTLVALVTILVAAATGTGIAIALLKTDTGHPAAMPPTASTPGQATTLLHPALCAFVTKGNAWIFTAPSLTAPKLRSQPKPIDSGITILSGPHPPGWTPVLTPRDVSKRNWMQTNVLSTPYHGESPCPDRQ